MVQFVLIYVSNIPFSWLYVRKWWYEDCFFFIWMVFGEDVTG